MPVVSYSQNLTTTSPLTKPDQLTENCTQRPFNYIIIETLSIVYARPTHPPIQRTHHSF